MSRIHKPSQAELTRLEALEAAAARKNRIDVKLLDDYTLIINPEAEKPEDKRIYKPSPTFEKFHADDTTVKLIKGPYGTGKSTGSAVDGLINTIMMPKCKDGVRRARGIIVRNTSPELWSTTIKTWENWFGELGVIKKRQKPILEYEHTFNDKDGKIILEVIFLALDNEKDIRKLKSLEATWGWLNEASEIDRSTFDHIKARIGRYPSKQICNKKYKKMLICDTNPPTETSWIYEIFETEKPDGHIIYHQPSALLKTREGKYVENPAAENIENIGDGYQYYFTIMQGQTAEFINVFIMGNYGLLKAGKPIYPDYNDDWHCVPDIEIDRNHPVHLKADYGIRAPALLVCQYVDGQLRVIKEFCGAFTTMAVLYEYDAMPWLKKNAVLMLEVAGDPSNTAGGREELESFGLPVDNAITNNVNKRIQAVTRFLLSAAPGGKPRLIISKRGCPNLRTGFIKSYVYKEVNTSQGLAYRDYPDKEKHPFSDIHDCLQYEALDYYHEFDPEPEDDPYDDTRQKLRNEQKNRVTGY